MLRHSLHILLFTLFAFGLPIWAMQNNDWDSGNTHQCIGECYQQWLDATGGVVAIASSKAAAKAAASPSELGQTAYAGCIACHGANGEGGVGPQLSGASADTIQSALMQYRAGETRGAQSALMWSQAGELSDKDIQNLAAYIQSI